MFSAFKKLSNKNRINLVPHKVAQQMSQLAHVACCGWWRGGGWEELMFTIYLLVLVLGKIKLDIIFIEWVKRVTNLND